MPRCMLVLAGLQVADSLLRVGPGWLGGSGVGKGCSRGVVGLLPSSTAVLPTQSPKKSHNPYNIVRQKMCQVWYAFLHSNTSFPLM